MDVAGTNEGGVTTGTTVGQRTRLQTIMAEREGFEPPDPRGSTVFKTAAIDRSATSPDLRL